MAEAAPQLTTPVAAEPAARIQAMLDRENAPPPTSANPAPAAEAQPEQKEEAHPEQPTEAEVPAGPNKGTEGEDAPPAREVQELPIEQVEAIELEVTTKGEDGNDVTAKLPISELKKGYMREADYSRKTAALARQREEVSEKSRQAIDGERKQFQETIQQLQALVVETVAPELSNVDLNKLATDDPFEYVKRRNRLDQIQQTLSKIQIAQKEWTAKQQAEMETKQKETIAKARETLQADIPGWNDTLYQNLMKAGEDFGYTVKEIAEWTDPRAIKLLYAAEKGKTGTPARPSADKKLVAVPKAMKPGASADQVADANRASQARKQLRDTGSVDAAAAVIRNMLK